MHLSISDSNHTRIIKKFLVQLLFFTFHSVLDILAIIFSLVAIASFESEKCNELHFTTIVDSLLVGGIIFLIIHSIMISSLIIQIFFNSCSRTQTNTWCCFLLCSTGAIITAFGSHCLFTLIWIPIHINAMNNSNMSCFLELKGTIVRIWIFAYFYLMWVCIALCLFCLFFEYFNVNENIATTNYNSKRVGVSERVRELENVPVRKNTNKKSPYSPIKTFCTIL